MRRILYLLVCAALLGVLAPARAQDSSPAAGLPLLDPGQHIGINYGIANPDVQETLDDAWFATLRAGGSGYQLAFMWDELEPAPGEYDLSALDEQLSIIHGALHMQPLVTLRAIDTVRLTLPADLIDPDDPAKLRAGLSLDSPEVIERFGLVLDRVVPVVADHGGFFISVANEIDPWLAANPDQVEPFLAFMAAARARIQALAPRMGVGATITYGALQSGWPYVGDVLALSDAAVYTYYPLEGDFTVRDPGLVPDDIARMVEAAGDLPVIFQELGYPSGYLPAPGNRSSGEKQAQFVDNVIQAIRSYPQVRYASFLTLGDWPDATCDELLGYYGLDVPRFREFLCTLGLITYEGEFKPAYDALIAGLEARTGPPPRRTFYMGMTPWPYDFTPEAQRYTYLRLAEHTDMILHHLDSGVPWPEALAGEPYDPHVLALIEERVAERLPEQKVYLAITPNGGGDRSALGPYWAGDDNLPLPADWQGRALDDPLVVAAYLNYANFMIEQFQPDYFAYAIEVTCANRGPDDPAWHRFLHFASQVYPVLKAQHPDLPIFATVCAISLENDDPDDLLAATRQLLPFTDLIGLSVYPYLFGEVGLRGAADPANIPADWLSRWAALDPDRPFAITETAYIAEDLIVPAYGIEITGTSQGQADYMTWLLDEAQRLHAEFVIWFVIRDYDNGVARAESYGIPTDAMLIWRDTGLLDRDGAPRPALGVWDRWLDGPDPQTAPE